MPNTAPDTLETPVEQGFELVLLRQGLRLPVEPGERITDVLQLAGVAIETVCEQGICGTCVTRWTAGDPEHHDRCLTVEERSTHVALCCARNRGAALTLDL
ncbi:MULTISPECIES: 2Fe-2S iron-sulfur cluster-binding protein [Comamonas]|jgi:vanillate O-demethylase ferredoxin subunit|uniref:2Fe-2S iron-sulfur cluster-binding protein n=1 Tax=Comamonas TaxID=283 RepID=UPI0012BE738C|nr:MULTISPECIES: 2Fe-2S iron-sulfur cluster binding domain-containing protein [Comamonas]MDR3067078.1 2Fe-2S iron-sulfur cluster binding domain-containing protein [Comamonas sp.]MEB5963143.1 2Fe-2S iron-sulfur cluster binding domain-containing protein [Comamonas testosteroni]MPS96873.1 2Fe-2S iron-sulfur cluster binding domain-containing protein [Comamonas sp.]